MGVGAYISIVVEALCCKPEGLVFETQSWINFAIYLILPGTLGAGVFSATNRNEYQEQKNVSGE
jgi:hypothetical protein